MKYNDMVDLQFSKMADNAKLLGDHFARSDTDRHQVLAWCSAARGELAEVLARFPIGQDVMVCLDAIDRTLDVIEARSESHK